MLGYAPTGSLNLADIYGQPSSASAAPAIVGVGGPQQGAVMAGANVFGQGVQTSAPAWALILLVVILVGIRVAFEFSTS